MTKKKSKRSTAALGKDVAEALLATLEARFEAHGHRHPGASWAKVRKVLVSRPDALWTLHEMERTGGEPDVVQLGEDHAGLAFVDCTPESPKGRVSLCYDGEALASRKENKPAGSAVELAAAMGVALLTEAQYHELQRLDEFDQKTSSWLATPAELRARGGALFGDRRYGRVFVYHNGAQSYYAARGFRGVLRVAD